ncbi:MAG: ABC transporter substrate-binding protein [Propionibacteriaceae bacterium]|jgi:peptide/nickel transport system substrate-binding protein|nr:ABC transporter substrate-binding protein [Propionibacteriaceae bacterium]
MPNRFKSGAIRLGCTAVAAALLLTGCSNDSGDTTPPTNNAPAQNLVIGVTSDVDTLFPWKATQFNTVNVMQTLYGTLVEFDENLAIVPGIATSWETSDDGLSVTFKLREGVKFADGSPCEAEDVKFSYDAIMDEATGAASRSSLASVLSVEAVDSLTVVLHLSAPDVVLLSNLAVINLAILSSTDTEESLSTTPNGTGPFKLQERKPSQSLILARNENYWGDSAKLDTIEFRVIPDETSIVSAMQAGNVQLSIFDDPVVAQTAESAGIKIQETSQLAYHVLQLNTVSGPLADVNFRLAIQCAVDRQEVLDTAASGEGEVTGPITAPAFRSDPKARPCPTKDITKAKEYLAASAYPEGATIRTIVSQGEYATSVNEATNVQAQLAEIGITLDLQVMESGAYVTAWLAADFEAAIALNGGRPEPYGMYNRYFISTGNLNTVAGYSSEELDTLFDAARQESDTTARANLYQQISKHLEDNAVWVWLFTSYTYAATTSNVSGFTPMANDSMQYLRTTSIS